MKNRILRTCCALLLAVILCVQGSVGALAASPTDAATEANVLEVLQKYEPDAYHIMKTEQNSGNNFLVWFMGDSLIAGMDTAVHETYHIYTFDQCSNYIGERIYLGNGKYYDVDYSIVYTGGSFTKTEAMAKQIPAELQTFRYKTYVSPGASADANTKSVFGLLNEFTAYYWGLKTMNSLAQFLLDTKADAGSWQDYITSIGNNACAYAEFKYWTLRYMLYIKSANPSLYQTILKNDNYCAAYRDAEIKFAYEIERSRKILNDSAPYLSSIGCRVEWTDSNIYLWSGFSARGTGTADYTTLMTELNKPEYVEMDSILKESTSRPAAPPPKHTVAGFRDVYEDDYYADAVEWAVGQDVVAGTTSTTFSPNQNCTRAQIVTFLWRAAGRPEPETAINPFTDVSASDYYYKAVLWAYENGIVAGTGATTFSPNHRCTRAQTVAFLYRFGGSPEVFSESKFTDVPFDAYYANAVAWATSNGIVYGTSDDTFSPDSSCTRAQSVTFLWRYLGK
ncbi:MAG: S-layer homology domain-containing protein [Acutalibacter sp.]|nr:S-layer homology domain-containing protein [Acutalibacter sp.]